MSKYYTSGSAAKRISANAQPKRKQQKKKQQNIVIDKKTKQKIARKKRARSAMRRNRERALSINPGYMFFLTFCTIVVAIACVLLVSIQSSINARTENIAKLNSQLIELKNKNDSKEKEITTSVNIDYIKDVAINELGMFYATEDQIIYYTVNSENFMDQYEDIPHE